VLRKMFSKASADTVVPDDDPSERTERTATPNQPQAACSQLDRTAALGGLMVESEISSEHLLGLVGELPSLVRTLSEAHAAALLELSKLHSLHAGVSAHLDEKSRSNRSLAKANGELVSALRETRERADSLKIELGVVRAEHSALGMRFQTVEGERAALLQRVDELETTVRDYKSQLEWSNALQRKLEKDLKAEQDQLALTREALEAERTARAQDASSSAQEISSLRKDGDDANAQSAVLRTKVAELSENLQDSTAAGQASEERRRLLESEVRRIHATHATLLQRYEALEEDGRRQIREMDVKNEAVNSRCAFLEQLLASAREQSRTVATELRNANDDIRTMRLGNETLRKEIDRLSDELANIRSSVAEKDETVQALSQSSDDLVLRFREAQEARLDAERRAEAAANELTDATVIAQREIEDLRLRYEAAGGEVSRLRAERALLAGQLEVSRSRWKTFGSSAPVPEGDAEDPDNVLVLQSKQSAKAGGKTGAKSRGQE